MVPNLTLATWAKRLVKFFGGSFLVCGLFRDLFDLFDFFFLLGLFDLLFFFSDRFGLLFFREFDHDLFGLFLFGLVALLLRVVAIVVTVLEPVLRVLVAVCVTVVFVLAVVAIVRESGRGERVHQQQRGDCQG